MTDILAVALADASEQLRTALAELAREAAEVAETSTGVGLARVRQALGVAEAWAARFGALAEVSSGIAEQASGAELDDPPAPYLPPAAAPAPRGGLRLITGGADGDVQVPADDPPGGVVTIPQHLATALGVQPTVAEAAPELKRETGECERAAAIKAIRKALRHRSGKAWSVSGGRGTAWGWITIDAPPSRHDERGGMTPEDALELHQLLAMGGAVRPGPVSVESRRRLEFVARARGTHTAPYYPGAGPE